jgi:cell wall-associated NlpC family hydrolase
VATPHAVLTHVHHQLDTALPGRRSRRLRTGLLLGATAALTFTVLPGTAAASPDAGSPQQAAKRVADASHQLEIVTERVNAARVLLDRQKEIVAKADMAVAGAQSKLDSMAGQIRQLARSAYTSGGVDVSQLNVLMTSSSADQFVSQLGTLDAIAGHTNTLVVQVTRASKVAGAARARADEAAGQAQRTLAQISAEQKVLQGKIADYRRQYAALTAPQRAVVAVSEGGAAVAAPARTLVSAAPSGASSSGARAAVNTALAQVGKPYVWGAAGPNSFDCSGLMQYAWSAAGVALPHSSSAQSGMGTPVSRGQLQPGDLVFFYSPVSHVGMYIGNGQMVHAATSGTPVQVVSLASMGSYNSARRVG